MWQESRGELPDFQAEIERRFRGAENLQRFSENLQCFSENLQRFLENLQRFLENLQRFLENLQRFLEQVGVFQFDCSTLFAVPTASNHVSGLFHNI